MLSHQDTRLINGRKYSYLSYMRKLACFLLFFVLLAQTISAQNVQAAFSKEIDAFKLADRQQMPAVNAILLAGSSSFTKWTDVQDYFPGYPILNRGFGGSSLPDLIRYAADIILPYRPRQIIVYCGENDIATDTVTAAMVEQRFRELFLLIRSRMPKVPIAFISIKPSPSRWKYEPIILEANRLIKTFLKKQPQTQYIDIHNDMLHADGTVNESLFVQDKLHMNASGYLIWSKKIRPVLLK
jgi:lysophospholipase L1-like esterase